MNGDGELSARMMNWTKIDGENAPVTVTVSDRETLLADLKACLDAGAGFSVATLNLDHVVKLREDPAFRAAYACQSHVTADGNPIVWLSRLAGQREISLVPGSELIDPVAALAAEKGIPVGLFGATEVSLKAAAEALAARHSGLQIVHVAAPPMGFDPDSALADQAIAAIGESGARVVFLALGAPKQERFAARAQARLANAGFLSVGAGLDFVSGAQQRAPAWVRMIAAEWLWRLIGNPRRLSARYWQCFKILPHFAILALGERWRRPS